MYHSNELSSLLYSLQKNKKKSLLAFLTKLHSRASYRANLGPMVNTTLINISWLMSLSNFHFYISFLKSLFSFLTGSPNILVKSARIVSGVSELFLAFHLGQLIKSRGHVVLLSCGTIGYLLCFLGYALITSPFGILPVQVIHGKFMSEAVA